jgi:hypothetical protein
MTRSEVCVWAWDGRKKTRTDGCKAMSEEEYGRKNESMTRVSMGGISLGRETSTYHDALSRTRADSGDHELEKGRKTKSLSEVGLLGQGRRSVRRRLTQTLGDEWDRT